MTTTGADSQPLIDQATFGTGWIDIVVAGYANDGMGPYTLNLDSNSCNGGRPKSTSARWRSTTDRPA